MEYNLKTLIFSAGAPRSGSTLLYNMIRLLAEKTQLSSYATWVADYEVSHPANVHLIKLHSPKRLPTELQPNYVLTSYRPTEECIASLIKMGWLEQDEETISQAYKRHKIDYEYWNSRTNLEVHFEELTNSPFTALSKINELLGFECNATQISSVLDSLTNLKESTTSGYHPTSLLHPGHTAPYQEDAITAADVLRIVDGR